MSAPQELHPPTAHPRRGRDRRCEYGLCFAGMFRRIPRDTGDFPPVRVPDRRFLDVGHGIGNMVPAAPASGAREVVGIAHR